MKRIISVLLVAVMLVSCMATVAFAAESATVSANSMTVEAGKEYTVNVAISTATIDTYEIDIDVDEGLEVTAIDVVKYDNTMTDYTDALNHVTLIGFDSFEASKLFTLTVKVAEDAKPGEYKVNLSGYASNADEDLNITFVNGVLTIEAPETEHTHAWGEWTVTTPATCEAEGVETRTCECGESETRAIAALGHEWSTEWTADGENHWHVCVRCGEVADKAAHEALEVDGDPYKKDKNQHYHVCEICEADYGHENHKWVDEEKDSTTTVHGYYKKWCSECGYVGYYEEYPLVPNPDDPTPPTPPATGDISGVVTTGISALVIVLFSAVAVVIKRKTAV